jgi:hypothetical protein
MGRTWRLGLLGIAVFLSLTLAGCGDDGHHGTGRPGLVGIVDHPSDSITAPLLTIDYTLPRSSLIFTAQILSDQPTGGDIAFDPLRGSYEITHGPSILLFGRSPGDPEYRAFLDFPLDGSTGGAEIPLEGHIVSATMKISIDFIDFAYRVPVLLDLVRFSVERGLTPFDFDSAPLAVRSFDLFDFNAGRDVVIDVTFLMREAQRRALADFQVRFMVGG